jgi:hypothetical protein
MADILETTAVESTPADVMDRLYELMQLIASSF